MELKENELRNTIKDFIRESVFDEIVDFEEAKKRHHKKNDKKKLEKKKNDEKHENFQYGKDDSESSDKKMSKIKSVVRGELAADGTNEADYYYRLWPEKDEEAARSYGYKCRKGEENDSGSHYDFSNYEYTKLNKMLNSNH